ncbi:hypothetical protein [Mycobacterium sp. ACS1612]|uniref:hypothetical protein n=1 Tax=Mycobacterium sp. ACS1612 TaxID=1834117 RepID=UPI001E5BB2EA|nr:hypothetical protein [Mycobacterium sp. ACS1612]
MARRLARTTPGVIGIIALAVGAICVIAGLVCGGQLDARINERNSVLTRSEPFAYAAQNLYAALSAADAAAASAFLSGGIETGPMRAQYKQAVARAASALADATAGTTDLAARTAMAEISDQLTAYTGLVEAARANNRQGHVIGSAYLREASALMQTSLLPGAEKIYTADLETVERDQQAIGSLPIVSLVLLAFALAAIVVASVVMYRRTNRQFNVGLVVAAVIVLAVIGWVVAATQLAANEIEHSRTEGTQRFEKLAQARILAQQARTDETLELISRGDISAAEKSFSSHMDELTKLLDVAPAETKDAVDKWLASHRRQVEFYNSGDYLAAVGQAIGPDPVASAAQFTAVESSLRDGIERTRTTMRDRVAAAGTWLAWSPTGTLVLMVVAAAASAVGLWPRLKEFL